MKIGGSGSESPFEHCLKLFDELVSSERPPGAWGAASYLFGISVRRRRVQVVLPRRGRPGRKVNEALGIAIEGVLPRVPALGNVVTTRAKRAIKMK
ncbi:MAG TPA: hypothetical protein VN428_15630 [Bryobacteraceae bacterium]|nr:hypothetical protein [Bryobacteraceae bacterium]